MEARIQPLAVRITYCTSINTLVSHLLLFYKRNSACITSAKCQATISPFFSWIGLHTKCFCTMVPTVFQKYLTPTHP